MLWEIIKKQAIVFVRDPQQLILLLLLPVILITILSASLGGFISGDTVEMDAKVAIIEHEDEQEQIAQFIQEIENSTYPEAQKEMLIRVAKNSPYINLLKEEALGSFPGMELKAIPPEEKTNTLKDDSFAAVIEIPEQFTYETLKNTLLDAGNPGKIQFYGNEGKLGADVVKGIINAYQEQMSLHAFAARNGIDSDVLNVEDQVGHVAPIGQNKAIDSKQYYTIGMAVMNVLYIAVAIGSFAFLEKESQIFNRIILSNLSRWTYLGGVFASGTIFGFLQLLFIFGFSWIVLGVKWPVFSFFVITGCLAIAVGGLAVVLAAISYRFNSETVINVFSNILVAVLALLGGSFFPIGDLSSVIQSIGDFTPNGAGMTAYLGLLRGDGDMQIFPHLIYLLLFTIVFLVIAVFSFPKRGQM